MSGLADAILGDDAGTDTSTAQPSTQAQPDTNFQTLASPTPDPTPAPMPDASDLPAARSGNLSAALGATQQPDVVSPNQEPMKGLGGRLRGILYGLATAGVPGAVEGAIAPNVERTHFNQNEAVRQARTDAATANAQRAQNDLKFESVSAGDTHILASKQADNYDRLNEEARIDIAQKNAAYQYYLEDKFNITPDLQLSGNGQEVHDQAVGGLSTLAGQNGGVIPPVHAVIQPHNPGKPTFDIAVFSPSPQKLAENPQGYRSVVDTARAVQGLPPVDDRSWNSGGIEGRRAMVLGAQKFLSPVQDFDEQNLPAVLASRKQMLAQYQNHTDASGNPDADPATVSALQSSVDFLTKAQADVSAARTKQASDIAAADAKARLPYELAKTKAEEAVKDGDPNAAGQLLVNGDVAPSQLVSSRKPSFATQAFSAAKRLDPTWNSQAAEGYFKAAGSPQNVQFFGSAKSLTDQGGTLDQLQAAYDKLPNGRIPALNKFSDWASAATGGGATAGFAQTAIGVADDYSKVLGGGQGSDTSRDQVLQSFARSGSPQQMAAAISAARLAVDSQMKSRIGKNPVIRNMYGDQLLIHVQDPKGGDHVFRTQQQADSFRKAAGL